MTERNEKPEDKGLEEERKEVETSRLSEETSAERRGFPSFPELPEPVVIHTSLGTIRLWRQDLLAA